MKRGKKEVVDLLRAMGIAMKGRGDVHRSRAYARAANAIEEREDFDALVEKRWLRSIPGVGEAIEKKVHEFLESGKKPEWLDDPTASAPRARKGSAVVRARAESGSDAPVVRVPQSYRAAPFPEAPDLHVHTTWSDGTLTLEQVVLFAKKLGAPAVGITDHSGSLHIARGLKPDEVKEQWRTIDALRKKHKDIKILKGTECDILRDGRLDHPEALLKKFDFVVASLHSQLRLPEEEQTKRVLAALDSPYITVLGHPTTRVPDRRPRANLDLKKVFATAARNGVALEVNGNPGRIDLDEALARQALKAGARLSCSSDGHSAREMLSLATARTIAAKAGAKESDLVNYDFVDRSRASSLSHGRAEA